MGCNRIGQLALIFVISISSTGWAEDQAAGREERLRYAYAWKAEAEYPRFGVEAADQKAAEWVKRIMNAAFADAQDVIEPNPDFADAGYEMGITYRTVRPLEGVASVVFEIYTYHKGAAHPLTEVEVLNLDLENGEELTLDDIFANPDKALEIFAREAPALINARLRGEHPDMVKADLGDDDFFKDGFTPARENYSALSLEPGGVRVHFQQYQVLPYVFGLPDPLFPLEMLAPAGPSERIWPK